MASLNMQCASYFANPATSNTTCAQASARTWSVLCANPVSTCPAPTLNATCKASAQDGTYTSTTCLPIPLNAAGALWLPPALANTVNYSSAAITTYTTSSCQGQPATGGVFALDMCNPSPFNDGTWGYVYADYNNNLFFDQYDDANCDTYYDSKMATPLSKPGSTCLNKASASLLKNNGFKTTIYYTDDCTQISRIVQERAFGPCQQQRTCTQSTASNVFSKVVSCDSEASQYNFEDQVKSSLGSKPYALMVGYGDKNCQTTAPTNKGAVLLDVCYVATAGQGSKIWTQAANGSLIYSYYTNLGCTGSLKIRESFSTGCGGYSTLFLFNTKLPLSGSPSPKSSNGSVSNILAALGASVFAVLSML
ncbi:hypothetical protein BDR26DRAFT_715974 [Obelidium mucronatum]|nr:hypothetical protein BDR26DRAFT_715974 [Obelidium mucronatum]